MAHRIAVIAGDGIGKEVMPEGLCVISTRSISVLSGFPGCRTMSRSGAC